MAINSIRLNIYALFSWKQKIMRVLLVVAAVNYIYQLKYFQFTTITTGLPIFKASQGDVGIVGHPILLWNITTTSEKIQLVKPTYVYFQLELNILIKELILH